MSWFNQLNSYGSQMNRTIYSCRQLKTATNSCERVALCCPHVLWVSKQGPLYTKDNQPSIPTSVYLQSTPKTCRAICRDLLFTVESHCNSLPSQMCSGPVYPQSTVGPAGVYFPAVAWWLKVYLGRGTSFDSCCDRCSRECHHESSEEPRNMKKADN